jgi:type I restriction enzyme S subunit
LANAGSQPFISYDKLRKVQVQIPELEYQNQVVQLLESFESLLSDKTPGLPAELKARRQQYEYYRSKLLTFKELDVA